MKQERKWKFLKIITLAGCFSAGIIYGSIGVIALLSFFKLKKGGADENSFFVLLNDFLAGRMLNWMIIAGAMCFIIWRFYEAFADPHKVGNDIKGILIRTGAGFSSGADAFIIISVMQALFSKSKAPVTGEPIEQRQIVAGLLETALSRTIVVVIASIVLLTAVVLVLYGLSRKFSESIKSRDFSKWGTVAVHAIAYAGYCSRGVILGIVGFFLLKAVVKRSSTYVVNTDKAFDFIGDQVGHIWFIAIAVGTISYGLYMFILGLHYDTSNNTKPK